VKERVTEEEWGYNGRILHPVKTQRGWIEDIEPPKKKSWNIEVCPLPVSGADLNTSGKTRAKRNSRTGYT